MMQDEVNKIVFNALADGREIWFPGVGSLVPEFRSAWRASARQLERPSRRIAFLLSEQRGVSVIDLIARAGACDVAAAEDIYSRWLDKARVEDGISIPGVGELNHRYFRLDPQLDAVLNPLGHDPLPLKRRYSRLPLYLGIALFCTAAVGYGIWQYGEWMRLPFVGGLFGTDRRLFPAWDAGLYRQGETALYVSRGLGYTNVHFRLFNRPEVAVIVLRRGSPAINS